MVDSVTETDDHQKMVTRSPILQFGNHVGARMIFSSASHGIQNPVSISTLSSYGLERDKLWDFVRVLLEHLSLHLLKLGPAGFYNELDLAIDHDLLLPVVNGLNTINNVNTRGKAVLYERFSELGTDLLGWTGD